MKGHPMSFASLTRIAGFIVILIAQPSFAHVTLETAQAAPNSTYKGVLRVPHGCKGEATTTVRIQIPEGVIGVKPMPKPGWTLNTVTGTYTRTYDYFGMPASSGVTEIIWSGGSLPDAHYDEFVFRARLTGELDEEIYFPSIQQCATGAERWTEIPAKGQDAHALKSPAPSVRIVQAQTSASTTDAPVKQGALLIETPWSRVTPKGAKVAGGYVRITNTGTAPDRLIGGSFSASGRIEVHEMSVSGGIMRMRELDQGLEIAPGATVELKPGGYHLMFMDMQRDLQAGEMVKGTLVFANAGTVNIAYRIAPLGATSGASGHTHH
jgi:periplasmic copper chaperone A